MGSDPRPIAARYALVLLFSILTASCANTSVQVSGGGPVPTASAPGSSALGVLMLFGFAASYESSSGSARMPVAPLDPSRRVLEADCTKPIEDWSANLKCR